MTNISKLANLVYNAAREMEFDGLDGHRASSRVTFAGVSDGTRKDASSTSIF